MTTNNSQALSAKLLPCPFCGCHLVLLGDYTEDAAWNWWGHPDADDSKCVMAKHEISTHADMQTPNAAAAVMWNTRTAPAEPSDAEIDDKILAVAEYVGITRDRIKAFVGAARMVGYDFVRTEAAYKRGKGE